MERVRRHDADHVERFSRQHRVERRIPAGDAELIANLVQPTGIGVGQGDDLRAWMRLITLDMFAAHSQADDSDPKRRAGHRGSLRGEVDRSRKPFGTAGIAQ